MIGDVESRGWTLNPLYDGCDGGWAVRIGQPVKYAVRVGGYRMKIKAEVVEGPFGLDVVPNAEDWAYEHTRLGMPVPPIPCAARARTWWDRFKECLGGIDQNAAVPRVGRWESDIGAIVTPIVAVCRHENGIPVVAEWVPEDPTYFEEEEAKLLAAFELKRAREYDAYDDADDDEERGRREPMTRTTKCDRHESDDGSSGLRDSLINVLLVLVIVFFLVYFGKGCIHFLLGVVW